MIVVVSSVFHTLQFPRQGKIVTIDQLDYFTPNIYNHGVNNVPFIEQSKISYDTVGAGLKDSSLMVTISLSTPKPPQQVATSNTISTFSQ